MKTRLKVKGPIQWYEGMMLAPHHFQQDEFRRYQEACIRLKLSYPFAYGFSSFTIDTLALAKNLFVVSEMEGVFPDGEIFSISQPLQVSLGDFATHSLSDITIWLGIAPWDEGVSPLNRDRPRYKVVEEKAVGSYEDASNLLPISRLMPIVQIYAAKEKSEAFVSMPIATLQCEHNVFSFAPFIAPCFHMSDAQLILDELRKIAQLCRKKELFLLKKYDHTLGVKSTKQEIMTLFSLDRLRSTIPCLEMIINNPEMPPFEAYKELIRILGKMTSIQQDIVAKNVVPYHHERIYHSFLSLLTEIKLSLDSIVETYQYIEFDETQNVFSLLIHPETKTIFLSMVFQKDQEDKIEWLNNAIIVSDSEVDLVVKERITGAKRRVLKHYEYPQDLYDPGDLLIEVEVDNKYVFKNKKLIIFNPIQKEKPEMIFWCVKE